MDIFSDFSLLTIGILGAIAVMTLWFAWPGYNSHSAGHSPTILTSVGIFGTFLGVALGLLDFNTTDIQASVPGLIEGLKTAFWTSIAGLLGALIVKFRHLLAVLRQRQVAEEYRSATITDLANLLGEIRDSLSNAKTDGLRKAISEMQAEQNSHLVQFRESMESYQSRMVKANTAALITAIKAVMRNFNTQINEQYGDNFKELNHAVGQMLQWQENYKKELQALLTTQQSNTEILDRASTAYQKMVAHTEVFNKVSESMGTMLSALEIQSQGLDKYLTQLAKVADQAASGLPALENRIDSLTEKLAASVVNNQRQVAELMTKSAQAMKSTVDSVNQTLAETLQNSQKGLHDKVEAMIDKTEQQVRRLDDAMEDELVKALKTFGYQMTSLSEKFVNDYTPLTDKLQQVLSIAHQLPAQEVVRDDARTRIATP